MLRKLKILLVLIVMLWGFVGATHNVMDWEETTGAVSAVTTMATFEGGAESRKATSNAIVIWAGALFITLSKLTAGFLSLLGALRMWQARDADGRAFAAAKEYALAGAAVAVIMLFGGFIVIAESWFELWRSDVMRGPVLDSAFRYAGMLTLIALFVATPDE